MKLSKNMAEIIKELIPLKTGRESMKLLHPRPSMSKRINILANMNLNPKLKLKQNWMNLVLSISLDLVLKLTFNFRR